MLRCGGEGGPEDIFWGDPEWPLGGFLTHQWVSRPGADEAQVERYFTRVVAGAPYLSVLTSRLCSAEERCTWLQENEERRNECPDLTVHITAREAILESWLATKRWQGTEQWWCPKKDFPASVPLLHPFPAASSSEGRGWAWTATWCCLLPSAHPARRAASRSDHWGYTSHLSEARFVLHTSHLLGSSISEEVNKNWLFYFWSFFKGLRSSSCSVLMRVT